MNNKFANGMKMWKGNGNTTILFSLKRLEIVHQERRGQVKTMVIEDFNGILFHKSLPANKQHTVNHSCQSVDSVTTAWRIPWFADGEKASRYGG